MTKLIFLVATPQQRKKKKARKNRQQNQKVSLFDDDNDEDKEIDVKMFIEDKEAISQIKESEIKIEADFLADLENIDRGLDGSKADSSQKVEESELLADALFGGMDDDDTSAKVGDDFSFDKYIQAEETEEGGLFD